MEKRIIKILENHEDEIMKSTMGDSTDEYGERYAWVYRGEWREHKPCIAHILAALLECNVKLDPVGVSYIIISEWSGVMIFENFNDMEGLIEVSKQIIKEIYE